MAHETDLIGHLAWADLAAPLAAAEDALARLDERLRASPIRDGWIARSHFADACASLWIEGDLVAMEDLVLHDADADVRAPTLQLLRAKSIVDARRLIVSNGTAWSLSPAGIARLSGEESAQQQLANTLDLDDEQGFLDAALADIDAALARSSHVLSAAFPKGKHTLSSRNLPDNPWFPAWQRAIGALDHLPPVLAAGLLWDAWEMRPPVPRRRWIGRQLVGAYLAQRGKTQWHLPALNMGLRQTLRERRRAPERVTRLLSWLEAVSACANAGLREHDRISVALALLQSKCTDRRSTSRLPDLVVMVGAYPLITVAMAARELCISQRAAQNLIDQLGLRETTGRGRYRAWML
ncbi:RHE_PE00001 family protein [Pseudochelatococcus sp. G4_1912]|uniref:RHE_PE00001 family protein n=1 Tax=Pseudochelatococcus sp. G4_1912 TaxID=3114288 RepID=UPI0039C6F10B